MPRKNGLMSTTKTTLTKKLKRSTLRGAAMCAFKLQEMKMSRNEAHGDEDFATPPDAGAIAECTKEIIEDGRLLKPILNDDFLAYDLSEIMCAVDGACNGSAPHIAKLIRACSALQKTLMAHAADDGETRAAEREEV
jgi:hypothetical protein